MSEIEKLAQEQLNVFKKRLHKMVSEVVSEIEDENKFAFMQGYAKGETDEMFRTKQVVTKDSAEVIKLRNQVLKAKELLTRFVIASVYFKGKETDLITEAEQLMSEKNDKLYRYVWRDLERNALRHYKYLTFFQKLKWGFNKKKYIEWYCENNKQNYYYLQARR